MRYLIYIEGAKNIENGDLKKAFHALFEKAGITEQPRIIMGNGISQTVDKFKNHQWEEKKRGKYNKLLLIDLDGRDEEKDQKVQFHGLEEDKEMGRIFFMVQAMEAWFIAQKSKVAELYGNDAIKGLPGKPAHEIVKPKIEFSKAFEKSGKFYNEVRHGSKLLGALDTKQLMKDFPDVKNLVTELSKA